MISWVVLKVTSKCCLVGLEDVLIDKEYRYVILDVLGAGTFGQVVKCKNIKTQQIVAVKVVKNKTAYSKQSMMEVAILEMVRKKKYGINQIY